MDNKKYLSVTLIYVSLFACNSFLYGMNKNSTINNFLNLVFKAQLYQNNSPSISVTSCGSSGMGTRASIESPQKTKDAKIDTETTSVNNNSSEQVLSNDTRQQSKHSSVGEQSTTAQDANKQDTHVDQDQENKDLETRKENVDTPRVIVTSNGLTIKIVGSLLLLSYCVRLCQYLKSKNNDDEEKQENYRSLILKRLKKGFVNDLATLQHYIVKFGIYLRLQGSRA